MTDSMVSAPTLSDASTSDGAPSAGSPSGSHPRPEPGLGLSVETLVVSAPDGDSSGTAEWAIVRVDGEIDVATGPELRRRLIELVDEGVRHVVLDLSTVPFLDSSALGVFVTGLKRLRIAGGTMRLAACRPPVRAVLKITSLDRVFFLYPSVEAALADETEYVAPTGA